MNIENGYPVDNGYVYFFIPAC